MGVDTSLDITGVRHTANYSVWKFGFLFAFESTTSKIPCAKCAYQFRLQCVYAQRKDERSTYGKPFCNPQPTPDHDESLFEGFHAPFTDLSLLTQAISCAVCKFSQRYENSLNTTLQRFYCVKAN